ncbi:hypothetical protein BKA61DRAFT_686504 [Leptodontidium sp. MPI-SDFR-AT-0119]|nr:hypothetical protein BKA61DRAFT_686504 [Leptodontidium sp. MPI-SDFR-AT-0119]
MPKGLFHEDYRRSFELGPCLNPEILLKPLKLLRNIPRFQLGELEKVDVPDTARSSVPVQSIAIRPEYREDLTRLVQGNSHSLRVFEIYEKLLAYAQSFERHRPFSVYMDSKWGRARDQHGARLLGPEDIWYRAYQKKFDPLKAHPFKKFLRHPVEMNLEIASLASEDNDLESFRSARKAVIQYLEPQYKRIKAASSELKEFIKHEKQNPGPCPSYCPYPYFQTCEEVIYLSLIEDYHQSFVRDAPTNIRRVMRRWQREFELIYSTGKREIAIKKLSNWVELLDMTEGSRRTPGWRVWAKEAVDDMDEQYFQIQASRKALFEADPDGDYGCGEFDAENSRSDEMVESSTPPDLGSDYGCGEFDVESYRSDERADYKDSMWACSLLRPSDIRAYPPFIQANDKPTKTNP